MRRVGAALGLLLAVPLATPATSPSSRGWPQFGGPDRDFRVETSGLQPWGPEGPTTLWERDLGEGYSGIASDGDVLYTMYRPSAWLGLSTRDEEVVVAIDAATGETLWEQGNPVEARPSMNLEQGKGPHSTPLLAAGRLFTVGVAGHLQALDPKTGRVLWARELWEDLGGKVMDRGYSCSPLAWRDTVIVAVGGRGQGLVAFDQKDGSVRWKGASVDVFPSSPVVVDVAGQEQFVYFASDEVVGFDPTTGERLWGHPHRTSYGLNIALPVTGPDGLLVVSSAYSGGTRALSLSRDGDATRVEELWFTNQMRVHHGNLVRIGDHIYGSSGDFGPTPLSAVDLRTGEVVWRDRAFAKATLVLADGRLIALDEDGTLGLATVSPSGLEVQARARVFSGRSWTAPTLVGTRLYLRDRKQMVALDLGRQSS
jgi:outer membrane protein assembly factor BamB